MSLESKYRASTVVRTVCGGLLVVQARVAVVLAVELVHRPQQDVQASISRGVLCSESLTQGITLTAGACELLFKCSVPHHPSQTQSAYP